MNNAKKRLWWVVIALLPHAQREGYRPVTIPPRETTGDDNAAIEAQDLTIRFGNFVAVDHVHFRIARGTPVQVGAWIDGAMPTRAETVRGYVQGMHLHWLTTKARERLSAGLSVGLANIETRFRSVQWHEAICITDMNPAMTKAMFSGCSVY